MTESKVFIVDYSLHDNAVEELKKDSIKNNPDNQSKDADDSIFTGIDFFNKTGFVLSGYLDDYFKNFHKFCGSLGTNLHEASGEGSEYPEPTDSEDTYRKFCQFVSDTRNDNFTSDNPGLLFQDYCDTSFTRLIKEKDIKPIAKFRFLDKFTFYCFLTHKLINKVTGEEHPLLFRF